MKKYKNLWLTLVSAVILFFGQWMILSNIYRSPIPDHMWDMVIVLTIFGTLFLGWMFHVSDKHMRLNRILREANWMEWKPVVATLHGLWQKSNSDTDRAALEKTIKEIEKIHYYRSPAEK